MELPIRMIRGWLYVLRELSLEQKTLLEAAAVDARLLDDAESTVALPIVHRLMRAAATLTAAPGLGLLLGERIPLQSLGIVGELVTHAPTLRAALGALEEGLPRASIGCQLRLEPERASIGFETPFASAPAFERFATDLVFALVARLLRQFVPEERPLELQLRHAAPSYAARYEALFSCPVRFGAASSTLVVERTLLDRAQPFHDRALWQLLVRRADQLRLQERARERLHERVQQVLRSGVDLGHVSPQTVARKLGLSPRSLRRRLHEEGHSLTAIADRVRRELSIGELQRAEIPIKQIAERVGFSEVSAFHRAFKRWTGLTPARYRAQAYLAQAS